MQLGDQGANCLFYRAGLEFALNGITDLFIPFIGADYNAFYDTSIGGGFAGFARAYAGIRTYPFGTINDKHNHYNNPAMLYLYLSYILRNKKELH